MACAIDGTRSVQDLAWQCGLALYDVIERVGALIQAGVCVPGSGAEATGPLARLFGPDVPGPATLPVLSPTRLASWELLAPMPVRAAAPVRSRVPAHGWRPS